MLRVASRTDMSEHPSPALDAERVEARLRARLEPEPELLARLAEVRANLVRAVGQAARERKSPLSRALIAGSAARGTFLKDRLDVDLFMLFPPTLSREELSHHGLGLAEAVLTAPERRYADHPYLRGSFQGFTVDAVPGYAVTDPSHPLSPVDRTPFHDEYLRAHETAAMVADVRVAKQFLRGLEVYGSEARTQGFSGYLVELLVLQFGGFHALVESARTWRIPARIRPASEDPPRLPEEVALILADPVDPHRNVASALSRRNLALFVLAADAYLADPSENWFRAPANHVLTRADALVRVAERGTAVVVVELPRPSLVDDTLYPQIRKAQRALAEEVGRAGFTVLGSASAAGVKGVLVALEVASGTLPAVRLQDGPPVGLDRVGSFLEKWTHSGARVLQGPYVDEDGRLAVETRRPEREIVPTIQQLLPRLSLGKNLTPGVHTLPPVRPLADQPDSPELDRALTELFGKHLPWRRR